MSPPATHECPQKNSAHSVQLFGRPEGTYTNVLFYYVDYIYKKWKIIKFK